MIKLWSALVWLLGWLYVCSFQVLWDALGNSWRYAVIFLRGKRAELLQAIQEEKEYLFDLGGDDQDSQRTFELFKQFKYGFDGLWPWKIPPFDRWPTWTATVMSHHFNKKVGNCQDSAHYGRWLFKELNRYHDGAHKWGRRLNIYVPLNPLKWFTKIHYFASVVSPEGVEYQLNNGRVSTETRDALASRMMEGRKYVWLTGKTWSY
jgi:hypothetical protein